MLRSEKYLGYYGMFPTPEFVFHVGPSENNPLADKQDYERRTEDVHSLLAMPHENFARLELALLNAFGQAPITLHAEVRMGGWKGTVCPSLCINTLRSTLANGRIFYGFVTPELGENLSWALLTILDAEWIACQHYFGKPFQLEVKR